MTIAFLPITRRMMIVFLRRSVWVRETGDLNRKIESDSVDVLKFQISARSTRL